MAQPDDTVETHATTSGRSIVEQASSRLASAMDYRLGTIPPRDQELLLDEEAFALSKDAFWFETPGGVQFYYRLDGHIVAHFDDAELEDEFRLYLDGTAYGAVAWLQGLLPLHAGAVVTPRGAIAITGPSGAGKSTLVAALDQSGFPVLCDDTLVVIPTGAGLVALPDKKPIKLWDDAIAMLGTESEAAISSVPGKNYVRAKFARNEPARLTDLILLEKGDGYSIEPITGANKLEHLVGALYRGFVHVARGDGDHHSRLLTEAARTMRFWRHRRPLEAGGLDRSIAEIERLIASDIAC